MADSLLVHEIYLSIQGESTFAGLPCAFVRLTGCDLRCSYCDTAYAFTGGQSMIVDEVVAEHGRLDLMVNNAGITGFEDGPAPHDPENASLAEWHRVHSVNTDGCFLGCRYALRAMKAKGTGSIINMSSRSGLVGIPGAAAYAASKAAMRNHTKSVALYAAQQGWAIRCNSIHPAAILTDIWEPMLGAGPDRDAKMAALVADTPLKRFGTVEEVAATCVFLASADSAYMTGAELTLDGGLLAGSAASPGS